MLLSPISLSFVEKTMNWHALSTDSPVGNMVATLQQLFRQLKPFPREEIICTQGGWEQLRQHFPAETHSLPTHERFCGLPVTVVAQVEQLGQALCSAWRRGAAVWLIDADKVGYFPCPDSVPEGKNGAPISQIKEGNDHDHQR